MMKLFSQISKRDLLLFILFAGLSFYIPFNAYGCVRNQIIGVILVAISLISSIHCNAMQIAFFMSYVAATAYPLFGIPLHISTLIEFIFIGKVIFQYGVPHGSKISIFVAVILQLVPLVMFGLNPMSIVKLICNILLFCGFIQVLKYNNSSTGFITIAFVLGVLTSCIAGFYYVRPITEEAFDLEINWLRYCGLWTDPNFLGGFCLISICYLLTIHKNNWIYKVLAWGVCAALFYFGTLTLSRTYLVVSAFLAVFYVLFVQRSGNAMRKIMYSMLLMVITFVALNGYLEKIDANRRIGSEGSSGGRSEASMALIDAQLNDPVATIFGVGYDNGNQILSMSSFHLAAHNTYVDVFLQFGVIGLLIIMGLFLGYKSQISSLIRSLRTPYGVPMLCLLLYLGTLSALKYEFIFVISAIFIAEHRRCQG